MKKLLPLLVLVACTQQRDLKSVAIQEVSLGVTIDEGYPKNLSEWNFFEERLADLKPAAGVFMYELNSPLFSDYAFKKRFIRLPEGEKMTYNPAEVFDFPSETILIKNFYYPADFRNPDREKQILETRLLINESGEWKAIVYEWNEDQSDAKRKILGASVPVEWTDENGKLRRVNYNIPSQPQCKSCHDLSGELRPIGPSARQLNRDDQLEHWSEQGLLDLSTDQLPALVDYQDSEALLDERARAWLEINCAHCHRKEGPAKNTGLYLLASQTDPYKLGVNKPPVAAGRGSAGLKYSIVPGHPDQSILLHRMQSLEPGEMMPELGRTLQHEEGVLLIREWIENMN